MNIPNINYLVIGSPKCATTTLCKFLEQHPEVFISDPKEPRFFSRAIYMKRRDWAWYNNLFQNIKSEKAIGEGTVNYTCSDYRLLADPEIIYQHYPNIKLIYMVRDPIERIESHWLNHAIMGWPSDVPDFDEAIRNYSMFLNTSRYWSHINRFRRFFPDEQIHTIFFEDFVIDAQAAMQALFQFLEVDPYFNIQNPAEKYNPSDQKFRDGNIARKLRKSGLIKATKNVIPQSVLKQLLPLFKVKNTGHPEWRPETLSWVVSELKDDSFRFLEYCSKSVEFWKCYTNIS